MSGGAAEQSPRNWTTEEEARLELFIDAGKGYDYIARKLGRSRLAVTIKAKRLGIRVTTTDATLSARDVATLLGLGCAKTVVRWIVFYGLKASNAGTKDKPLWRVQVDSLLDWLAQPEHWMAYNPERVTDSSVREYLTELRPAEPYWLPIGDAAKQIGVTSRAVNAWIAYGYLPATKYGNWWIRAEDVRQFTPPCERPREVGFNLNSLPVLTPRRTFATVHKFARWCGVGCQAARRYLVRDGNRYILKRLSTAEYRKRAPCYRRKDPVET